jgi:arylsulfatase
MTPERPNVLFITCDCLRADFVGCCTDGTGGSLTPNLDKFARNGIIFRKAFAQGFRTPISMPSLFTGKYPHNLQLASIESPFGVKRKFRCLLMGKEKSVAEILAAHGYQTAGFHSNPLLTSSFGYRKGFGHFYEDLFLPNARIPALLKRWLLRLPHLFRVSPYLPAHKLNRKALAWLASVKQPFFLWVHYMDAHGPYLSKRGFRYVNKIRSELLFKKAVARPKAITEKECQTLRGWYREEVGYLDHHLGKLFAGLERMNQLENTVVVVTADHGEEFREHGRLTHHSTLYDEIVHVPVLFKLPHSRHAGTIIDKPVGLIQILPTLVDILGLDPHVSFDERSLFPLIEQNDERALCRFIMSQGKFPPKIRASARTADWKLILDESRPEGELYDLTNDPKELCNVINDRPDVAVELARILKEKLENAEKANGKAETATEDVDPEVLERLRELGYL